MAEEQIKRSIDKHFLKDLFRSIFTNKFNLLEDKGIEEFVSRIEISSLKARECLFKEGDSGDKVYMLLIGKLIAYSGTDERVGVHDVGHLSAGDIFGEITYYYPEKTRNASIYALRDSYIASINNEDLREIADLYPSIHQELIRSVITKLDNINKKRYLTIKNNVQCILNLSESRLSETLFERLKKYTSKENGYILIDSSTINSFPSIRDASAESFQIKFESLLMELESNGKKILLEVNNELNQWAKVAIKNCDKVIIVNDIGGNPKLTELENELVDYFNESHVKPHIDYIFLNKSKVDIRNTRNWLKHRSYNNFYHITPSDDKDIQRVYRLIANKQVGVLMSGGGMPGIAHAGAFRALEEKGIYPDYIAGVSMGAVIAGGVGLGWSSNEIEKELIKQFSGKSPFRDYTFPSISLLKGKKLNARLKSAFKETYIEDLPIPYFCIATDIARNREVVLEDGLLWKNIRASVAIPGILPPVLIGEKICVDGGLLNSLPVDIMKEKGVNTVIAFNLINGISKEIKIKENYSSFSEWLKARKSYTDESKFDIFTLLMRAGIVSSELKLKENIQLIDYLINISVKPRNFLDRTSIPDLIEEGYTIAKEYINNKMV